MELNLHIMNIRFENGHVVTGTVKWEDKRGGKAEFGELPWHHITLHNECGKGKRTKTETIRFTPDLTRQETFDALMRKETGDAVYMQQIHKFATNENKTYGNVFAKLDDEALMDIILTCQLDLGTLYEVLVNKPCLVMGALTEQPNDDNGSS